MSWSNLESAWPGLSADVRFARFDACVAQDVSGFSVPASGPPQITRDNHAQEVIRHPDGTYSVREDIFEDAAPDLAVAVGQFIAAHHAEEAWKKWVKEKKQYEKDRRKEEDKRWKKLLKDAKPKGNSSKAGAYWAKYYKEYYGKGS